MLEGDQHTIEAAHCFLELRPYFFRSGYMRKELLRKINRGPLSLKQLARLQVAQERQAERNAKRASTDRE